MESDVETNHCLALGWKKAKYLDHNVVEPHDNDCHGEYVILRDRKA